MTLNLRSFLSLLQSQGAVTLPPQQPSSKTRSVLEDATPVPFTPSSEPRPARG